MHWHVLISFAPRSHFSCGLTKILLDCYGRGETEALSGDVADEIRKKLFEMEHGHNVKIVYATEAGSRA